MNNPKEFNEFLKKEMKIEEKDIIASTRIAKAIDVCIAECKGDLAKKLSLIECILTYMNTCERLGVLHHLLLKTEIETREGIMQNELMRHGVMAEFKHKQIKDAEPARKEIV